MTLAFISDLHLTPERPISTELFNSFICDAASYLKQLYILGDLFEYWVGDDGSELLGHQEVENTIRSTVKNGTEVFFLHGNRDFLIGQEFSRRTGCKLITDPMVIEPCGHRILLTHGDALCVDDLEHQKSRNQMLSSKWKMAFLEKPVTDRCEIAGAVRATSESRKQYKPAEIMDVNQQAVEQLMREHDVLTMIHGHTHKPAAHDFNLDGQLARRFVLGDWYTRKSTIFYHQGKLTLRK